MLIHTRIASLNIIFSSYDHGLFTNFWTWKLDPFRILDEESSDLMITQLDDTLLQHAKTETFPLLRQERSGFFFHRVRKLPDDRILYQLVNATSEECMLAFSVNPDWNRVEVMQDKTESGGSAFFEYLSQITPGVFLKHHLLTFHAALVEYHGYAFALCADSGVGKTTRAHLWRDYKNALILNGDRAVCKRSSEGWTAYGTPWSGTSGEQINRSAPLRAMVILERADAGKNGDKEESIVRRLTPEEAFPRLFPHLLYPNWDENLVDIAFTELDYMLCEMPIFLFRSNPDAQAIDLLEEALEELS